MSQNPVVINGKMNFEGCFFEKQFLFSNGNSVPLYYIDTTNAFNQLVGFAKFKNSNYGNVYYRGTCGLYDNVLPALMRNRSKGMPKDLNGTCWRN